MEEGRCVSMVGGYIVQKKSAFCNFWLPRTDCISTTVAETAVQIKTDNKIYGVVKCLKVRFINSKLSKKSILLSPIVFLQTFYFWQIFCTVPEFTISLSKFSS